MRAASIRILLVDDHDSWRNVTARMLQRVPESEVVGEASDGLEAIQLAKELRPDLIVLDVGLLGLNGIEAARSIRALSPNSRILFMSENRSNEIALEALRSGGHGYVVKSAAANELLPAIQAVLTGKQFVSTYLDGFVLMDSPPRVELSRPNLHHEVGLYCDDLRFVEEMTRFIGTALKAGNPAIALASESHLERLLPSLQAYGVDVDEALDEGRFAPVDALGALSAFMVKAMPDPVRFMRAFSHLIRKASESVKEGSPRIAIFGEAVQILCDRGNPEAALQVEKLGNQLGKGYNVDILCGYARKVEVGLHGDITWQQICAQHSAVYSW